MKHYLITGGAGFIGANFVHYLLETYSDISIHIVDTLTYAGNIENIQSALTKPNVWFHPYDIRDLDSLRRLFGPASIDAVIHFAAESHVDRSIASPMQFVQTNVEGTLSMLELAKSIGIKKFVHISTDEVYGSLGPSGLFTETSPLAPNSPYSASKAGSDLIARSYFETYGLPVVVTRCSNNYGPYQFPEKLIPLMIFNAVHDKPLPVYGEGTNVRDWIHVRDHCRGIDQVCHHGTPGDVYNLGGNAEYRNIDVVTFILKHLDKPSSLIQFVDDRLGHDFRYAIDFSKSQTQFGWTPTVSFEEGLKQTIDWYLENLGWLSRIQNGDYRTHNATFVDTAMPSRG